MEKDYYYILGLEKGSSLDDIKKAYRKLSKKFHPDKNDGDKFFEARFKEIQEAYEYLTKNTTDEETTFDSSTEIMKSEAKYATSSTISEDGHILTFLVGGLAIIFVLCSFYAVYDLFIK